MLVKLTESTVPQTKAGTVRGLNSGSLPILVGTNWNGPLIESVEPAGTVCGWLVEVPGCCINCRASCLGVARCGEVSGRG